MSDIDSKDFSRDGELVDDPYPYLAELRSKWPVRREPRHDVVMVTGYHEALTVLGDWATFSSCMSVTGPFPGFPVPLDGDDVSELIDAHRDAIPMSDQIITLDPPPTPTTAHC
jgi:cytochrome P450 family 150 subfamily A5